MMRTVATRQRHAELPHSMAVEACLTGADHFAKRLRPRRLSHYELEVVCGSMTGLWVEMQQSRFRQELGEGKLEICAATQLDTVANTVRHAGEPQLEHSFRWTSQCVVSGFAGWNYCIGS